MSSTPDLSLPSHCPELARETDTNWDDASFALYTLVELPPHELQNIASLLEKEWIEKDLNCHLVRIPTRHNFVGKSLRDIVHAHVQMDKELTLRNDPVARGDIAWFPIGFLVITSQEWRDRGVLFVYVDYHEPARPVDKFFFRLEDAYMMLSSINFGDEECARSKEIYEIGSSG